MLPHPVDVAFAQLRAAVLVYLHELRWDDAANQPHKFRLEAELSKDGALVGDLQLTNITTGEVFGVSL